MAPSPHLPVVAAEKALEEVVDGLAPAARDFAEKVSSSPAAELGELFADKIRFRRWKNQVRLLNKASEYAKAAGIDPRSVNLTILNPLLEKAGNEEDESMANRWAALLANAAGGAYGDVSPSFPDVLARLSPRDAQVLDAVHLALSSQPEEALGVVGVASEAIAGRYDWPVSEVQFSFENLQVLGLCASGSPAMVEAERGRPKQGLLRSDRSYVVETEFGKRFLMACSPPGGDEATAPPGE
jgi:Abortive infection alpha